MNASVERRAHTRRSFAGVVIVTVVRREFTLTAHDLSEGGMLLWSYRPIRLTVGHPLGLRFAIPTSPVWVMLKATVAHQRRVGGRTAWGVAFQDVPRGIRESLSAFADAPWGPAGLRQVPAGRPTIVPEPRPRPMSVTVVRSAPVPAVARRSAPTIPDAPKALGPQESPATLEALARAAPSEPNAERGGQREQQHDNRTATRIANPELSLDELALAAREQCPER